jgi:hypothetical protein
VKAYRLLDPVTRRVSIVRDVIFDDGQQYRRQWLKRVPSQV